jgi:hypothetical protein
MKIRAWEQSVIKPARRDFPAMAGARTSYMRTKLSEIAPSRLAAKSGTCCWVE